MSKSPKRIPSFLHHKATGQGYVVLDGKHLYLGRYDKPDARQMYHRTIAEWVANGYTLPAPPDDVTITELCAAYMRHAKEHYVRPDGSPTDSLARVKQAIKPLRKLYGYMVAAEFGPNALRAVREVWIESGLARSTISDYVRVVKQLFKWAVSREMLPVTVHMALESVEGLKAGRSRAKETDPVKPVPVAHIREVKKHVSRQVEALIDLQLLTAARSGELVKLRAVDLDTTGPIWTAKPEQHKSRHHGKERIIRFGPRAQLILKQFFSDRPVTEYLFSPKEAERERHNVAKTHRSKIQKPNKKKTERKLGNHYTTESYRRAVRLGCEKADVPNWTPHRLRHNAATQIRKEYGLEASQILLGHARADVTQIYAERDDQLAIRVIEEIG